MEVTTAQETQQVKDDIVAMCKEILKHDKNKMYEKKIKFWSKK
jgi:hypothetical protein